MPPPAGEGHTHASRSRGLHNKEVERGGGKEGRKDCGDEREGGKEGGREREKEEGRARAKGREGGKRSFTGEARDPAGDADIVTQGLGHPIFERGERGKGNSGGQGGRAGGGRGSGGPRRL